MEERVLYKKNPAMFASRPILFTIFLVLILFYGLGLLFLIIWYIKTKTRKLTLTNRRVIYRSGLLTKNTSEIRIENVSNVITKQKLLERIFDVGKVAISSSATANIEITIKGIKRPAKVKEIILNSM